MVSIIFIIVFLIIAVAIFFTLNIFRTKGHLQRALNMKLLLIRVPREEEKDSAQDKLRREKELISVSEQLFASLATLKAKGWNKFIYGEPYIALEMAVHNIGEETHFYVAVPNSYAELVEKQIHSFYPKAAINSTRDYNIFNHQGSHIGAYITLEKNEILPFRSYQELETDPLSAILTSMSKLEAQGEGAALQLLIRPKQKPKTKRIAVRTAREMKLGYEFKKALWRAKHPPTDKERENEKDMSIFNPARQNAPKVVTQSDETIINAITDKANKHTFEVNALIVVSAPNEFLAEQLFNEVKGAFSQYNTPDMNTLKISRVTGRALRDLLYRFSFRLFNENRKMFLSTRELSSIYHFPTAMTAAPKVNFLPAKASEPPPNLPSEGVEIGINRYRGQNIPVRMQDQDRRRHLYIIGQTGVGKSSLMKHMIEQDLAAGKGLCIIEPHGDFAEHALSVIPPERFDDVIYFNPADLERPIGLNILEFNPKHPEQKTLIINELLAIIDKLYNLKETGGPIFEKYFKNACLLLMDDYQYDPTNESKKPILADISRILVDDKFRRDKLSREQDPLVKTFWEMEAEKARGDAALANMSPYISTKIDTFVSNDFLKVIINQKNSTINFSEVINQGKILIVSLSKGRIGENSANLLGMMVVAKLLAASLERVDIPEEQRRDFYLYLDEFQNITTDSISTILSEARKYRLDLIIAHQFIKQLPEKIRDSVFGNAGSLVAFRVGADDAEYLEKIFQPEFNKQDLLSIDNFNAHVKMLVNNKTTRAFNIETIKERDGNASYMDDIINRSRMTYGRDRMEVEAEIKKGYNDQNDTFNGDDLF